MGDAKIIPLHRRSAQSSAAPAPRTVDEALALYLDTLYATARFLCRSAAASEDLVQETALAAFRAWGELRDPEVARGWLLRILYRQFLNDRRHDHRRPPVHDIELDTLLEDPLLVDRDEPIDDPLERDHVVEALQSLPAGFGEITWLVDALELAIPEAAEVLAIPIGTAASRLHRARRMLRERLAGLREGTP